MKTRMLLCALLILFVSPTLAQWTQGDEPLSEEPWRKAVGDFGAMLLLTAKPGEFLAGWGKSSDVAPIELAARAPRGVPIVAFVVFSGCAPDAEALCNTTVDFKVFKPDGTVYGEFTGMELWQNKPLPPTRTLHLGEGFARTVIEPEDPLGFYGVEAIVRDLNAGVSVFLRQEFEAVDGAPEKREDPEE